MHSVGLLSVIVPIFNEIHSLERNILLIAKHMASYVDKFELLLVDDGSTDGSSQICDKLVDTTSFNIRVFHHPGNIGPGSGLLTGFKHARGDLITFIPADIAIDLHQFDRYLRAAINADIVVGIRSDRNDYSPWRKVVSISYIWAIRRLFGMPQKQFNYIQMYSRRVLEHMQIQSQSVFITAEILIRAMDLQYTVTEIDVRYVPREVGHGSCGRPRVIVKTIRDMVMFWMRRRFSKERRG